MTGAIVDEAITIRFDGLDADAHEIEIGALAESLRGLSRIIGVCGNFAATNRYVSHRDALAVRVVVVEPRANCFEILAWVKWAAEQPLIATAVGGLIVTLITYVFSNAANKREEMRQLRGALDTAIKELGTRDQPVVDRLLTTIDKMADALRPAVKQAVVPVGQSARTLYVGAPGGERGATVGEAEKAAINEPEPVEITQESDYEVTITELDIETGSCRVYLPGDPPVRVSGTITDPTLGIANNPYATALASMLPLTVRAKAMIKVGEIDRLYISDARR